MSKPPSSISFIASSASALAEGGQKVRHDVSHQFLLIARQFGDGEAGELLCLSRKCDSGCRSFLTGIIAEGDLTMFAIERLEELIGALRLIPVDVARMFGRLIEALSSVAVKNWAAKCGALHRIAIAAARDMPAGEDKFKFALARFAGLAEHGDGAGVEPAVFDVVMLDLLEDLVHVFLAVHIAKNFLNHCLLIRGEEFPDWLIDDHPVVVHF